MSIESAHYRAKRPRTILAGPYGHPIHGILVTVPIGSWVASLVFDIVALTAEDGESFAAGARLLVLIGIVGALLAAVVGLLDLSQLEKGTRARRIALTHMSINLVVVALFAISLGIRWGASGASGAAMVVDIVALALLGVSGFLGGELVNRYGVRVADEQTQQRGFTGG